MKHKKKVKIVSNNVISDGKYLYSDTVYIVNSVKKQSLQKVIKVSDFMIYASKILKENEL